MSRLEVFIRAILGFFYFKIWKKGEWNVPESRVLHLDLPEEALHRYPISLINMLNAPGAVRTNVVFALRIGLLAKLFTVRHWKRYEIMMLESSRVFFTRKNSRKNWKRVSVDYFSSSHDEKTSYRVPIGVHPLFWDGELQCSNSQLREGVFFSGAADISYGDFDEMLWQMPSRLRICEFLCNQHPEVIINGRVEFNEYVSLLRRRKFFLALPGYIMPLCHNMYEAIYMGAVPICHSVQLNYVDGELRRILSPFSWQTLDDLSDLIRRVDILDSNDDIYVRVVEELRNYWANYLSGEAIYKNIEQCNHVILCAEEKSVVLHAGRSALVSSAGVSS